MKEKEKEGGNGHPNQINLVFIVNGEEVPVSSNENAPLKTAVLEALRESENVGQDPANWQVKYSGNILDMNAKIKDLELTEGTVLHLSPRTGEGG